jgi:hypothetical protein
MGDDISKLLWAIQDLVKVTKENSDRLQEFIEWWTRPQPTKSIEDLQNENPVTKVHEYLLQKKIMVTAWEKHTKHETRENIKKFATEKEAKQYMIDNKWEFRTVIETKYVESLPPNPTKDAE